MGHHKGPHVGMCCTDAPKTVRLDKFLKLSSIVPRRTRAKRLCENGLVSLDGSVAKASSNVRPGQKLEVTLGRRKLKFEVLALPTRPLARRDRESVVKLIDETVLDDLW